MALIKCRNCNKDISDKSTNCIHCGAKVMSDAEYDALLKKKERKRKKRKKIKKAFLILLSLIGIVTLYIILTLIFAVKSIDFTVKYKDYLDYALGNDWKIIETEKYHYYKNFWGKKYYGWTISYKDINNDTQTIRIYNDSLHYCKNEKECSDYIFGEEIVYNYRQSLNDILEKGNTSRLDKYINIIDIYEIYDDENKYSKDLLKVIDSNSGLTFKDLSIDNLDSNYYYLELSVLYNSGSDINGYTINESKKIIEKYKIKNAIISAGMVNDYIGEVFPIYCLKDNEEVSCPDNTDLDSMNKVFINENNYISFSK